VGNQYAYITVLALAGAGFVVAALLAGRVLRASGPYRADSTPYECGIPPTGDARGQFSFRYYLLALLFLLFNVQAAYLFLWAIRVGKLGLYAFLEMVVFLGIIGFGLAYVWRKGGLRWE
jgi:NADH-quinone oxidoreductase subunit A